jgi:hypothetical protein
LPAALRSHFEPAFGQDLTGVRLHTNAEAAERTQASGAEASTQGAHISFAAGRFRPDTSAGRELLAHELAHTVQQTGPLHGPRTQAASRHEAQADRAAAAALHGRPVHGLQPVHAGPQHRLQMRDVGRGEQSGFARLDELIDRLNDLCPHLIIGLDESNFLTAEPLEGTTLTGFEQQLVGFVEDEQAVPLRLTNRHGLLRGAGGGFTEQIFEDAWSSGYVDIDDLLASSDLGLQSVLVHFLEERLSTRNYARRLGSASMDFANPGVQAEFDRVHGEGLDAEVELLRSFFGDPTIRLVPGAESGNIARVFTNARRDRIRTRVRNGRGAEAGVHAVFIDVVLRGSRDVLSADEYLALLERERDAAATRDQVARERLAGASEHRGPGGGVPAP